MLNSKSITGKQEAMAVLNCQRLPARLNTTETAVLLGFQEHDIAPLMAAHLLVPLGKPAQNAPKYFAAVDVIASAQDREWLSKATRALSKHWASRNSRRNLNASQQPQQ